MDREIVKRKCCCCIVLKVAFVLSSMLLLGSSILGMLSLLGLKITVLGFFAAGSPANFAALNTQIIVIVECFAVGFLVLSGTWMILKGFMKHQKVASSISDVVLAFTSLTSLAMFCLYVYTLAMNIAAKAVAYSTDSTTFDASTSKLFFTSLIIFLNDSKIIWGTVYIGLYLTCFIHAIYMIFVVYRLSEELDEEKSVHIKVDSMFW
eukprot:237774_1